MKIIMVACFCGIISYQLAAQNVGLGASAPLMKLYVSKSNSAPALVKNKQALDLNVSTVLYFKTSTVRFVYTDALKTIVERTSVAPPGLFTYSSTSSSQLLETPNKYLVSYCHSLCMEFYAVWYLRGKHLWKQHG